jgi:ABC-type amino acid transport substrate-binding protein
VPWGALPTGLLAAFFVAKGRKTGAPTAKLCYTEAGGGNRRPIRAVCAHRIGENGMKRLKRLAAVSLLLFAIFSAMPVRPLAAQTLRVGVCADAPPYHFQDDNGRPTGMHMDFLNHIGYLKGYQMEYILFSRVTDAVVALEKGGVDMVLGALPDDVLNNSLVRFTDALSASPVCMITSVEREKILTGRISGMQPFSVAYELGTATLSQLSRFQMNHTSVVGSQQQVCGVLLANLSDTVVGIKQSLLYMLEEAGIRDRYVVLVDDIGEVEYRLLVRASDRALYGILNDAILTLRTSGAYSEMQAAWMVDLELQDIQGRMRIIVYSALVIFAVAGVIIALGVIFGVVWRRIKKGTAKVLKIDENSNKEVEEDVQLTNENADK